MCPCVLAADTQTMCLNNVYACEYQDHEYVCNECMVCMLRRSLDYGLMFRRVYIYGLRTLDSAIYRFPNSTTVGLSFTYVHLSVLIIGRDAASLVPIDN